MLQGRSLLPRRLIVLSLGVLASVGGQPATAQNDPHRKVLSELGIEASGEGAVKYLRELHPTPQRQKQVTALIEQLASASFAEREAAMKQLLRMPGLPIAQLSAATESEDPEVRWRSREILQQSEGQSSQAIYAALKVLAAEAEDAPPAGAVAVVLAAIPLCSQSHLKAAAREALVASARSQDTSALRGALANGNSEQRVAVAAVLTSLLEDDQRASLYPLLSDRDDAVALEVARGLADVGEKKAMASLVRLLNSEDNQVRTSAVVTLRGLTGKYMGYAAYEPADKRYEAVKKWNTWVSTEGEKAKLTFPVPRRTDARGDLGGHTLVATGSKGTVHLFDPSGKSVWNYSIASWSAEKLQNGNFLIGSFNGNKVVEVEPATSKVVWQYDSINAMSAKPLANGNFLIADFNGKRVIEVTREKKIVWSHQTGQNCFDCDRLPNGNTMFGCPNYVREVTPQGDLIREWKIDGRLNGFQALPSGNVLVANYGQNKVVELTPDGEQVWEFGERGPCDVFRLPSGNTLISTTARVIEIGPDNELVREICPASYGSARM